jgi:hypothetical protein
MHQVLVGLLQGSDGFASAYYFFIGWFDNTNQVRVGFPLGLLCLAILFYFVSVFFLNTQLLLEGLP